MVDSTRTRILARRAAFVSSALAALGCPPRGPGEAEPVVTEPRPNASAPTSTEEPSAAGSTGVPTGASTTATEATTAASAALPSLEMPPGIGEPARPKFAGLFSRVKRTHAVLDELDRVVPASCSLLEDKCEAAWRAAAAQMNELRQIRTFGRVCPGSSADAKLYAAREAEHEAFIAKRLAPIEARIAAASEAGGGRGAERWEELLRQAHAAEPFPCLSISCVDW